MRQEDRNSERQAAHGIGVRGRIRPGQLDSRVRADAVACRPRQIGDAGERDRLVDLPGAGRPEGEVTARRVADGDAAARDVEQGGDVVEHLGQAGAAVLDVPRRPAVQRQVDGERTGVRARERRPPEAAVDEDRRPFAAATHVEDLIRVIAVGDGLEARISLLRPDGELGEEHVEVHGRSL